MTPPFDPADYHARGYAIIPDALDPATCRALRDRAAAIIEAFDPTAAGAPFSTDDRQARDAWFLDSGDKIRCFFEPTANTATHLTLPRDHHINKIGHALHAHDPIFAPASAPARHAPILTAAGLTDPRPIQSMYMVKAPGTGGEVAPHQDATFLHTDPETLVGLWFALADADRHNGCLYALPGAHRGPLRRRYIREGDTTRFIELDPTPWPDADWTPLEVPAGAAIVLHGRLPHQSHHNHSERPRPAYAVHYIDRAARWSPDNWLTPAP